MMACMRRSTGVGVEVATGDVFEQCGIAGCKRIRLVLICLALLSVFFVVIMFLSGLSSSRNVDFEKAIPDGALYVFLTPAVVFITPFLLVHFLPEDNSYEWITSDAITRRNILEERLRNSNRRDILANKQESEPFNVAHSHHILHIGFAAVHTLLDIVYGLLFLHLHTPIVMMIWFCWITTYILLLVIIMQLNGLLSPGISELGHSSKMSFGQMLGHFSWPLVYYKTGAVIMKAVIKLTSSKEKVA